jgi:hypothetical protein
MPDEDDGSPPTEIPENTCMFVLNGESYINDGCNCSEGFEPPGPPPVLENPEPTVFVPCVPIDGPE